MKCPYCGNDESPDSKFCGNCGQPLQQQVSQAAPRRSPQYRRCPSPLRRNSRRLQLYHCQAADSRRSCCTSGAAPANTAFAAGSVPTSAAAACCPTGVAASPAVRPAVRCRSLDSGRARNPAVSGDAGRAQANAEAQIQGQAHRPHRGRGDRPRVGCRSCPVLHVSRGHLGRNPAAYHRRASGASGGEATAR